MIHLIALITALVVGTVAEVVGIARTKRGKVDTYTEIVGWLSNRFGRWFLPFLFALIGLLTWTIPHFLQTVGLL